MKVREEISELETRKTEGKINKINSKCSEKLNTMENNF